MPERAGLFGILASTQAPPGKHRHRLTDASKRYFCCLMSAALLTRPRLPINYGNKVVRPPKGFVLEQLEAVAWSFRDRNVQMFSVAGNGRNTVNKSIMRIHQLIIDQYGWPERD